jgi:hypothetical protein
VLEWCYHGGVAVSHRCHNGVTTVSHRCHKGVAMALQEYCVTRVLQKCYKVLRTL